jgi:hypothetical protein
MIWLQLRLKYRHFAEQVTQEPKVSSTFFTGTPPFVWIAVKFVSCSEKFMNQSYGWWCNILDRDV